MNNGPQQPLPDLYQATIDALARHVAVIDGSGTILIVNKAWREFAGANGAEPAVVSEGANYLAECDRAHARGDPDARAVAALIREVAAGKRDTSMMEYACHSPTEQRWFKLTVTRLPSAAPLRLVIGHENISEHMRSLSQIRLHTHLLASVEQAVIATDLDGVIIYWNPFAEKLYGWTSAEVLGRRVLDVTPTETSHKQAEEIMVSLMKDESLSGEFWVRRRDGQSIPVHVTNSPIRDEQNQLIGIIGISTDITEQKKVEQALKLSAMVYQAIGEAIMVFDAECHIVTVNPAFTRLTGYAEAQLVGQTTDLFTCNHNAHFLPDELRQPLAKTGHWQGMIEMRLRSGDVCPQWLTIDTIYDEQSRVKLRTGIFSRITDQKRAEAVIWQQANFDALTGLPNRNMFQDRLDYELQKAKRSGERLALMFIDLDHFKEVNDTLGHDIGDALLKQAARRLSACIRRIDTVARIGGDEFTVIMCELQDDTDSVDRAAREILQKLAEPFRLGDETVHISGSIGITLFPQDATEADSLLKNADQAMYAAKSEGRNQFNYFMPRMQHAAQIRMRMANDLRDALTRRQLEVAYQPIVELASGAIHKAEALIRWRHPARGWVSPAEFIPIAEQTGMIIAIGEWVLQQAIGQAECWRRTLDPLFQISVNMSALQFSHPCIYLSAWLEQRATQGRAHDSVDAEIVVEITERLLLEVNEVVTDQLNLWRQAGIQLSIDDFGTGYSSLSYLKKFHVDYLKIAPSFVLKMTVDSDDLALCEAIIVMSHKLGIKVIAEGIETAEQRNLLTAAGCDFGQGYLFARPMPASEIEALLRPAGVARQK